MIQYSSTILDTLIAPGASTFTKAAIPDASIIEPQSKYWISNFFLNCVGTARFAQPMQAYAHNYLRRAFYAFREHEYARTETLKFLKSGGQSPTLYSLALFHWEAYLGQSYHAYYLLAKAWDGTIFKKGDGTREHRLNMLYNEMKHVESCIQNGDLVGDASLPVWLENAGLRSRNASLSFSETGDILKELAMYANALMNPATAKAALIANDPAE